MSSDADIVAHMVALKTPNGNYVRICTDEWGDTYREAIDCYRLRAQEVQNPAYAFKAKSKDSVQIDTLSIPPLEISKIDIYEFLDSEGDESVIYDIAFVFEGSGRRILIGIENTSIAGDVYLCCDLASIEERLRGYSYVRSITNA
ncbi:hypothetical protein QFX18_05200 [Saccharophagus degradans]|uniref:hypothetical protein n=1 Tax=Saccharophagus degradans TaxID=86304 RepID=UPI0024780FB2|nr:hypothetical protein [Saccharophagus degradans]WGO99457.1 hypothetical protein QFX18_05200 [Saccharophagus degradans]